MSQRLTSRFRKDGKSIGVAIRKNRSTTPNVMKALFNMAFQENQRRRRKVNGKSKNKTS